MARAESSCSTLEPFRILTQKEREQTLEGYLRFLQERNGEMDVANRTLSRREALLAELRKKPVSLDVEIDCHSAREQLSKGGDHEFDVDERAIWLIAVNKVNESEQYGIDIELDGYFARGTDGVDPRQLYVMLEEQYHTQLLEEACRTCGIEMGPALPPWNRRLLIHMSCKLPECVRWIPVLCGEAVGCVVLKRLRDRADVFSAQPEVAERLRSLLHEIWIDELGHVAFLRARIGPTGVRIGRALMPLVAGVLLRDITGLRKLGYSVGSVLAAARTAVEVPPEMEWIRLPT